MKLQMLNPCSLGRVRLLNGDETFLRNILTEVGNPIPTVDIQIGSALRKCSCLIFVCDVPGA